MINLYVILVYDIVQEDGGQKVWSKVFKTCKKYLHHVQNSVFEGELTEAQIVALNNEIKKIVRKDLDSVILFKSRNNKWLKKEIWTDVEDMTSNFL